MDSACLVSVWMIRVLIGFLLSHVAALAHLSSLQTACVFSTATRYKQYQDEGDLRLLQTHASRDQVPARCVQ